jgi:hypothetical protein
MPRWRHGRAEDLVHQAGGAPSKVDTTARDPADRRNTSIAAWIWNSASSILSPPSIPQ